MQIILKPKEITFKFFLINCWGSVVASVVLPQFVQSPLFFLPERREKKEEKFVKDEPTKQNLGSDWVT